jgi:basic membrane lipoprotein Med (substrate-binding protein (PBP1-ABC) superfamily)
VLLSSVLWDFRPIFKKAVDDINNGTFGTHNYNLNAATGISLLKSPYISPAVWALIEKDRSAISAGTIKIPLTPTEAQVKALLNK